MLMRLNVNDRGQLESIDRVTVYDGHAHLDKKTIIPKFLEIDTHVPFRLLTATLLSLQRVTDSLLCITQAVSNTSLAHHRKVYAID